MRKLIYLLFFTTAAIMSAQSELPSVNITTLEGQTINTNQLAKDKKITIISLWATWCVPCLKELDAINEVYPDWQEEADVELIAISVDDSRTINRVRPMVNGKDWEYEIFLDTNNDLKRALGASTVPLTLLIKDNKIVHRHSGYTPGAEFELFDKILELSN